MTTDTVPDESVTIANSRTNLTKRRRDPSESSSRRTQRNEQDKGQQTRKDQSDESNGAAVERKPKAPSRFFAILNCCSSSVPDNEGPDLPAKKAEPRQPASLRQPTIEKSVPTGSDSTPVEPKKDQETLNEKAAEYPSSHLAEDGSAPIVIAATEKTATTSTSRADASEESSAPRREPSLKFAAVPETTSTDNNKDGENHIEEELSNHDTTEEFHDHDVDMSEAPIAVDAEDQHKLKTQEVVVAPPQPPPPEAPLPGPPPTPAKQGAWLLPPPLPNLRGRKCLVLDLDETLVHSSFKVG